MFKQFIKTVPLLLIHKKNCCTSQENKLNITINMVIIYSISLAGTDNYE